MMQCLLPCPHTDNTGVPGLWSRSPEAVNHYYHTLWQPQQRRTVSLLLHFMRT
jgi:hypothetical protein